MKKIIIPLVIIVVLSSLFIAYKSTNTKNTEGNAPYAGKMNIPAATEGSITD